MSRRTPMTRSLASGAALARLGRLRGHSPINYTPILTVTDSPLQPGFNIQNTGWRHG
ncbi:hypothetical protein [Phaeovulum sp.]|uniref:hypothetical protein n=1 Tax=Phaeovulum sp. TaxID=2934796 RepID=UPI0039E47D49